MSRSFELLSIEPATQSFDGGPETSPRTSHLDLRPMGIGKMPAFPSVPGGGLPATAPDESFRPAPVRRFVRMAAPTSHLSVLQKWEGTVTAVGDDGFTAVLHDLTDPSHEDERIDLPFDETAEGDRELVAIGAVFYWCIGYRDHSDGQRERVSSIRFQRLPAWTPREMAEARAAAEKLAEQLDWR